MVVVLRTHYGSDPTRELGLRGRPCHQCVTSLADDECVFFRSGDEGGSVRSKWAALGKKALKLQPINLFYSTSTGGGVVVE